MLAGAPSATTPTSCTDCKIVADGAAGFLAGTYTPVVCQHMMLGYFTLENSLPVTE